MPSAKPRASRHGRNRYCRVAPPFVTFRAKRRRMLRVCLKTGSHDIYAVGQTLNEGKINRLLSCLGGLQSRAVISRQVLAKRISVPATPSPLGEQAFRPHTDRKPAAKYNGRDARAPIRLGHAEDGPRTMRQCNSDPIESQCNAGKTARVWVDEQGAGAVVAVTVRTAGYLEAIPGEKGPEEPVFELCGAHLSR